MRRTFLTNWMLMGLLVLALVAPNGAAAAQATFGQIVVFGTSLSDSGNTYVVRGGESTPPYDTLDPLLIPDFPYAKGGHHFSNGSTWIEQFARPLGLAGNVRPALVGSNDGANNYAVGGARAHEDGINVNLSAQVSAFLDKAGGTAPSDALYVIEIGGNDIRDALVAYAGGADGSVIIKDALTSVGNNVMTLYTAGARTFFIWNAPNLGLTPALRTLDLISPGAAQLAGFLTQAYNAGLDGLLAMVEGLPGIEIVRLDAYRKLNDLAENPGAFGLSNAQTACVMPNVPPFECQTPDEFLFWDGIHPTTAVHAIIAQEAAFAMAQH